MNRKDELPYQGLHIPVKTNSAYPCKCATLEEERALAVILLLPCTTVIGVAPIKIVSSPFIDVINGVINVGLSIPEEGSVSNAQLAQKNRSFWRSQIGHNL